jgi:hypothetical protein
LHLKPLKPVFLKLCVVFRAGVPQDVKLFAFGKPASAELKSFAETGSIAAFEVSFIKSKLPASNCVICDLPYGDCLHKQ